MEQVKKCTKCGFYWNISNFYSRKESPDRLSTICISCTKLNKKRTYQHWSKGKLLCLKCKVYKEPIEFSNRPKYEHRAGKNGQCKNCVDKQRIKRRKTQRGHLTLRKMFVERWQGVRDRAKAHNYILEFDSIFLQELWDSQRGICAISGIPMTYIMGLGRTPTNVSVDRKDSQVGYTKENTQLVCMAINQMKSDLKIGELYNFCRAIIENYEKVKEVNSQGVIAETY